MPIKKAVFICFDSRVVVPHPGRWAQRPSDTLGTPKVVPHIDFRSISGRFPIDFRSISDRFPIDFLSTSGRFPIDFRSISNRTHDPPASNSEHHSDGGSWVLARKDSRPPLLVYLLFTLEPSTRVLTLSHPVDGSMLPKNITIITKNANKNRSTATRSCKYCVDIPTDMSDSHNVL